MLLHSGRWLLLLVLLLPVSPAFAAGNAGIERWLGQELRYSIDFLWFSDIAEGSFVLTPGSQPGLYRAELQARTLGLTAWLTSERVQRYVSVMERTPAGTFRSVSYQSQIIKGRGEKLRDHGKRFFFDHTRRQVSYQRGRNGVFRDPEWLPMAPGPAPCDILTAFFNFLAGGYGPIEVGGHYRIPTFTSRGTGYIEAEILAGVPRSRRDFFPEDGMLIKITIDPEVFDTSGGALYVWFDAQQWPARGVVEKVIGLGDVRGVLDGITPKNP